MKTLVISTLFIISLAFVYGATITTEASTNSPSSTSAKGILDRERESLRKQIMDSLDHIDKLLGRIRTLPSKDQTKPSERQSSQNPITMIQDSLSEITRGLRNGVNVMRYQMNRFMSSSTMCNNPFRSEKPNETASMA
ncbi:uncharacterized protein LOC141851331 [Brevipalpus obovatus]|uniref:uncharacterized protein LOC141851331 n=1 Tax=Brevipalpus obovatus TaxID=246614 RepID=UPI003D9DFF2D